jgi:hypothetical protein
MAGATLVLPSRCDHGGCDSRCDAHQVRERNGRVAAPRGESRCAGGELEKAFRGDTKQRDRSEHNGFAPALLNKRGGKVSEQRAVDPRESAIGFKLWLPGPNRGRNGDARHGERDRGATARGGFADAAEND